jgi:hypothetical protein
MRSMRSLHLNYYFFLLQYVSQGSHTTGELIGVMWTGMSARRSRDMRDSVEAETGAPSSCTRSCHAAFIGVSAL